MYSKNAHTGMASRVDEFKFGNGFDKNAKIVYSAPDYSIPPTPASSYSNLHVVLDTVHSSSTTVTRGVLPPGTHLTPSTFVTGFSSSSSSTLPTRSLESDLSTSTFSSTPINKSPNFENNNFLQNRLDGVAQDSWRAVPQSVDPEQPMARSNESLTSLKSEVAPMPPKFVALEDFDDLEERKDRQLPESVDITLVDETESKWNNQWSNVGREVQSNNWKLRSNKPARDARWSTQWNRVGLELRNNNWKLRSNQRDSRWSNQWSRVGSDIRGNNWKLRSSQRDSRWSNQWQQVGSDIRNNNWGLRSSQRDSRWSNQWQQVGSDIKNNNWKLQSRRRGLGNQWNNVFSDLKNKNYSLSRFETQKESSIDSQLSWSELSRLEDDERQWRINRKVNAEWSEFIFAVNNQVKSTFSQGWSEWFSGIKNKIVDKSKDLVESAQKSVESTVESAKETVASSIESLERINVEKSSVPSYNGFSDFYAVEFPRQFPESLNKQIEEERAYRISRGVDAELSGKWYQVGREMKHSIAGDLANWFSGLKYRMAKRGNNLVGSAKGTIASMSTTKSSSSLVAPKGASYSYDNVDFTFKSRRVPYEITQLEEQERTYRMQKRGNPVLLGQWHRVGMELLYRYSLRPTLASTTNQVVEVASDLVGKAGSVLENISEKVVETGKNLMERSAPSSSSHPDFAEHGKLPLNLFAFTAEPIDFTFKSRRCPQSIIDLEEKERSERIASGVDIISYGKWNTLLSQSHKTLGPNPASVLTQAKEAFIESEKRLTGMFSSFAHSLVDRTTHLVDAAKHSHFVEAIEGSFQSSSTPSSATLSSTSSKAQEEAERSRRMNSKVDPMAAARLGRVQDELLRSVKSV